MHNQQADKSTNFLIDNKFIVINEGTPMVEIWEIFENTKAQVIKIKSENSEIIGELGRNDFYYNLGSQLVDNIKLPFKS